MEHTYPKPYSLPCGCMVHLVAVDPDDEDRPMSPPSVIKVCARHYQDRYLSPVHASLFTSKE